MNCESRGLPMSFARGGVCSAYLRLREFSMSIACSMNEIPRTAPTSLSNPGQRHPVLNELAPNPFLATRVYHPPGDTLRSNFRFASP